MEYKIVYLSKEFIAIIHDELDLHRKGMELESNLDFLVDTVAEFPENKGIEPEYTDKLIYIASYYLFHLVEGHPFGDGNKRTAFLSTTGFLFLNSLITKYDEAKVSAYLTKMNTLIYQGMRPKEAVEQFRRELHGTPEFDLIQLLFDLAASEGVQVYQSPLEVFPHMKQLILETKQESGSESFENKPYFLRFFGRVLQSFFRKESEKNK